MVVALIFIFVSTPVATRDLGYQGLVQKTRGSNLYVLNVGGRAGYYLSLCIGLTVATNVQVGVTKITLKPLNFRDKYIKSP